MHKSYLITGATGSFGNAFTRHLLDQGAERVVIFSRDEVKQAEMRERMPDSRLRWFIGDVRDRDRLRRAFEGVDVVVHAAALKRIEVGQYDPAEMVKTNVIGAMNVIEAAHDAGVQKVVALSTDKAYQPISPYGQSKALAESLFLNANNARGQNGTRFSLTRYGNVAGSRGSIIPKWRAMGETVQVTNPDCTRFWMTMQEACAMVSIVIREMEPDVYVPDLPAYRLGDLAEAMGKKMQITGLPAWEKLHEGMEDGNTSDVARRMSVDELKEALRYV